MMSNEKICELLRIQASEYFDGFCIVGFTAGSGEPCLIKVVHNTKDMIAVNHLLIAALNFNPPPTVVQEEA